MANSGRTLQGIEAHAPDAPRVKDLLISIAPLTLSGEAISGCVVTMVDLSQRKIAERQQLLMMRELDHRIKNTLALVLSISHRTAARSEEHTSELQSLMRISYAVFCLKKKKHTQLQQE